MEDSVKSVERLLRAFMRSPAGLNEHTISQRLGIHSGLFFRDVLPEMIKHGLLQEVDYRGSGNQRRFRLGARLDHITDALERCNGNFEEFLRFAGCREPHAAAGHAAAGEVKGSHANALQGTFGGYGESRGTNG